MVIQQFLLFGLMSTVDGERDQQVAETVDGECDEQLVNDCEQFDTHRPTKLLRLTRLMCSCEIL